MFPGPRETAVPLRGGDDVTTYYPVSVVMDGLGLNITVQSYLDNLDFGLIACRELRLGPGDPGGGAGRAARRRVAPPPIDHAAEQDEALVSP